MQICLPLMCLALALVVGPASVSSDPEPMARITRQKVFTSEEELKKYLDQLADYYAFSAKARWVHLDY